MTTIQFYVGSVGPLEYDDTSGVPGGASQVALVSDLSPTSDSWPVGCVYLETANVNPNTTFGFGTWGSLGTLTVGTTTVYVWNRTA